MMAISDGDLIKAASRDEVYLVEGGSRRWIPDPQTFEANWTWDQVKQVEDTELEALPRGEDVVPVATTIDAAVDKYRQWTIGFHQDPAELTARGRWVEEETFAKYDLHNKRLDRLLQYEHQTWGMNIGWTDDNSPATGLKVRRWFFTREGQVPGPICYGERIALGNGGGRSFARWEKRDVGIDLGWAQHPVFEWKVLGGNPGERVRTRESVALYNEREGDCLMYFDRTAGGDIGWPSSKTWEDQLLPKTWSYVKGRALSALGV